MTATNDIDEIRLSVREIEAEQELDRHIKDQTLQIISNTISTICKTEQTKNIPMPVFISM